MKRYTDVKCLTDKCENDAGTRGLCVACYATARMMVKQGITTYEELENKGMLSKARVKAGSLFRQQFYETQSK